jgi:hypothetical protein
MPIIFHSSVNLSFHRQNFFTHVHLYINTYQSYTFFFQWLLFILVIPITLIWSTNYSLGGTYFLGKCFSSRFHIVGISCKNGSVQVHWIHNLWYWILVHIVPYCRYTYFKSSWSIHIIISLWMILLKEEKKIIRIYCLMLLIQSAHNNYYPVKN